MFVDPKRTRRWYAGTEQRASGPFLILFARHVLGKQPTEYKAAMRSVQLRQYGHFMMGSTRVNGEKVVLSGSYGSDGLTCDGDKLSDETWNGLVDVPEDLIKKWSDGGGWNSAGSEAADMAEWALESELALRRGARLRSKRKKRKAS